MTKEAAYNWVRSVASKHLGKNIRRYTMSAYTGETHHNLLGGKSYMTPKEGKVVDQNDQFTLLKTGLNEFCVVRTDKLNMPVSIGEKVNLSFYQLRRFDGSLADGSEDPSINGSRTMMLTGAATQFPVKWDGRYLGINEKFADNYPVIRNPYLQDLIKQMEGMPVNNDMRNVVNILVDAPATNLSFNDPTEEDSPVDPPAVRCRIQNKRFTGNLEIAYSRCSDTYLITLNHESGEKEEIEDVHFDELGMRLIDAIDDGQWAMVKVHKATSTSRKPAQV